MTMYRIEMMTHESYNEMLRGSHDYSVKCADIEAESAEEAVAIAKRTNPNLVVDDENVRTVAEIEAEFEERMARYEAFLKAEEERKAKARAKREARKKSRG